MEPGSRLTGRMLIDMRQALLGFNEMVQPMHEWLDGQVSYFLGQGFTDAEARAMAAAEFVTVFGTAIPRTTTNGESDDGTDTA